MCNVNRERVGTVHVYVQCRYMYVCSGTCVCVCTPPGCNLSMASGNLLNGSVCELRRCLTMTERSMIIPLGSSTGSLMRVSIRGSGRGEGVRGSGRDERTREME